jgi:large subunit ribosomal protein L31e
MADKTTSEKIEREYVIPLRRQWMKVPRYKKANKAIKTIKEFLVRHMKIRDKDLNKVKIDKILNEVVWLRGIKRPPAKVKVKAVKEGDIVRVEALEMPESLKFKKARLEKRDQKAVEAVQKKRTLMQKAKEMQEGKKEPAKSAEEVAEENKEKEEKKASVVEATQKLEKQAAKQSKHETKTAGKMTQQKHQQRKVLAK